eukprot:4170401-Amphidinium_carterae.1
MCMRLFGSVQDAQYNSNWWRERHCHCPDTGRDNSTNNNVVLKTKSGNDWKWMESVRVTLKDFV